MVRRTVTIVTKANIVKLADGNFIKAVRKVGEEYPEIEIQERLVDAMCAKMLDPEFNKGIEVVVLPNLYGRYCNRYCSRASGRSWELLLLPISVINMPCSRRSMELLHI